MSENEVAALLVENADLRRRLGEAQASEGQPRPLGIRDGLASYSSREVANDDRYRRIVESAVDYAIIAADLDGTITDWNEAAESILGWSAGQTIGRSLSTIFTPEDVDDEIPQREMRFALTMGKAHDDRWHMRADGGRFFASGQMMPLFGDDDEPIGYLKILRDRTREETSRRELEVSRERLQFALDASALVGTWDWDVANDIVYADSRFAGLYGVDAVLAAEGVPFATYAAGIHPDDRERVAERIDALVAAGGTLAEEYRTIDDKGEIHWVFARGRCFHDTHGRPERFPGAVVDITTERKREARQTALLKIGDDLLSASGPVDYTLRALEILGETLELRRVGYATVDDNERVMTTVEEWRHAETSALPGTFDLTTIGEDFGAALRRGQVVVEDVANDPLTMPKLAAWTALRVGSVVNMTVVEEGRVRVILYLHDERPRGWSDDDLAFIREVLNRSWTFSRRRRAEVALIEAETRLRLAQEAADIGTFDYDLRTNELIWDQRCRAAFGIFDDRSVAYDATFVNALHPDDRTRTLALAEKALDPSGDGRFEVVYRTIGVEDAVLRWVNASGQTVVENGRTIRFVGAVRDVTEEKESQERQQLLTRELQHRVKNTLAMVNALANQTLRRAANAQDGLAAFSARLIALSHAHDILTQTSWTSAPIGAIVAESMGTHQAEGARRIGWSGPDVRLTAKQSLALALALHELATNALKYGALSGDDGTVAITWKIIAGDMPRLVFEWRERGGPKVSAPASRGFGSRLIEQSLAIEFGGTVEIQYLDGGVVCVIDAPMREDGEETEG